MFHVYQKLWSLVLLIAIAATSFVVPRSTAAQTAIDGRFGEYWHEHGGLPIFGLAISGQSFESNIDTGKRHLTQWFERNRFELHVSNNRPYDVLLGRLGVDRLQQLGRDWQRLPKAAPNAPHYFAETGHAIAHEPFWRYWSRHGLEFDGRSGTSREESLALFGLPLSEPTIETNTSGDRVLTQWFERARFEDHGAKGVLLGLLGNEVRGSAQPPKPTGQLKYFWPRVSPIAVWPQDSSADERGFTLHLAFPHATEPHTTITGGAAVTPPEGDGRRVTIRGQVGRAYVSATRMAVVWNEDGQRYMLVSTFTERELLAFADDLEALDLATFQGRLWRTEPQSRIHYFWPHPEEHELSILPEPHGGSFADAKGFRLNLYRVHSRTRDVRITGGSEVQVPDGTGRALSVRGQPATAYTIRRGAVLVWTEAGHQYMVDSDMSLPDLLDFTSLLQVIDLQTFLKRIRPE